MNKVACIGDISIDYYVNQERYFLGGISFNVASNLHSLGIFADLYSTLGNDRFGKDGLRLLTNKTPFAKTMTQLAGETTVQRIVMNAGERKFDGYQVGVLEEFARNIKNIAIDFNQYDLIHVPLSDGIENVFNYVANLKFAGIKAVDFSIDATLNEDLSSVIERSASNFDLIFIGGDMTLLSIINKLAEKFPKKIFVLTLGKDGATCFYQGVSVHQPALAVTTIVDTTGCGDAFQAGFIASWLKSGENLNLALLAGAKQAALTIASLGSTNLEITPS